MTPPRWSRAVVGLLGAVVVALGVLCFAAPTALFGPDSYRIPVRVSIGLLGAVAGGLGVAALLAAATGTSDTLRTVSSALLVVTTIAPAVGTPAQATTTSLPPGGLVRLDGGAFRE